jgi:hypothetical protein
MRSFTRFAAGFGISLVALTVVASVAEAQNRRGPLRVIVQKRSYFDAGNVVPVGTLNRYASQHFAAAPVYTNIGAFYGEETLPGRIGSGANPFANSYESPRF